MRTHAICEKCGKHIASDVRACRNCGHELNASREFQSDMQSESDLRVAGFVGVIVAIGLVFAAVKYFS